MTTPDAQARTLGDAIRRQQAQREAARDVAREIARDRAGSDVREMEGDAE